MITENELNELNYFFDKINYLESLLKKLSESTITISFMGITSESDRCREYLAKLERKLYSEGKNYILKEIEIVKDNINTVV